MLGLMPTSVDSRSFWAGPLWALLSAGHETNTCQRVCDLRLLEIQINVESMQNASENIKS
jgi:hypothetical protein